jgi:hypothetical protein
LSPLLLCPCLDILHAARTEHPDPADEFLIIPLCHGLGHDPQDEVEVVAQNGVSADFDGEDVGQELDAFNEPELSVLEAPPRGLVFATEKSSTNTATCNMA